MSFDNVECDSEHTPVVHCCKEPFTWPAQTATTRRKDGDDPVRRPGDSGARRAPGGAPAQPVGDRGAAGAAAVHGARDHQDPRRARHGAAGPRLQPLPVGAGRTQARQRLPGHPRVAVARTGLVRGAGEAHRVRRTDRRAAAGRGADHPPRATAGRHPADARAGDRDPGPRQRAGQGHPRVPALPGGRAARPRRATEHDWRDRDRPEGAARAARRGRRSRTGHRAGGGGARRVRCRGPDLRLVRRAGRRHRRRRADPRMATRRVRSKVRLPPSECGWVVMFVLEVLGTILAAGAISAAVAARLSARIVRQYERGIVFRFGRVLDATRGPGLTMIIPGVDRLHKVNMQIATMPVPAQEGITRDNVTVRVDAVVYFKVMDPVRAVVNVQNYEFAMLQVAQTSLRSTIGKSDLDDLLSNRERLNQGLELMIDSPALEWGIHIDRVEIKDVALPESMKRSMSRQAEAERERRARIISADGEFQASQKLSEAAAVMADTPAALQLRLLETVVEVAAEKNSTLVLPFPVELLRFLESASGGPPAPRAPKTDKPKADNTEVTAPPSPAELTDNKT